MRLFDFLKHMMIVPKRTATPFIKGNLVGLPYEVIYKDSLPIRIIKDTELDSFIGMQRKSQWKRVVLAWVLTGRRRDIYNFILLRSFSHPHNLTLV